MPSAQEHIRKTFVTGMLFAIPLAVTLFIVWWVNDKTQPATTWLLGRSIPFLGVLIALGLIYLIGMIANSLMGKFVLRRVDHMLVRLPALGQLYESWKQVALTPGGTEGTFSKVVMVPDESNQMKWLGFTSGRIVEAPEPSYCVFVPTAPNPISGRLYFVSVDKCHILTMTVEEAFKLILSTGNYVPPLTPVADAKPALMENRA